MTKIRFNATPHRPPNIAISLLLTGFGMIQSANVLIENSTIRSIIIGVAQSLIFIASVLKKQTPQTENTPNNPIVDVTNEPFGQSNDVTTGITLDIPNDELQNNNVLAGALSVPIMSPAGPTMSHDNPSVSQPGITV